MALTRDFKQTVAARAGAPHGARGGRIFRRRDGNAGGQHPVHSAREVVGTGYRQSARRTARRIRDVETQIAGDYLAGPLSAADFTLYPAIAMLLRIEKKKPDLDIRGLIGPKIGAWLKRIEALPYFEKTIPPHWK